MNSEVKILESENAKILKSENYNYIFFKNNGFFSRWGKQKQDDPDYSKFGPEIADIEISTICHGIGKPCSFCYKSNTPKGKNMSYKTFIEVFNTLPKTITQIAFGIGDISANSDMIKIFEYCIINGVIPNVTINGYKLTEKIAKKLKDLCGAVAVSHYEDSICFDAVKKLTDLGMNQINIHQLLSEETYDDCMNLLKKVKQEKRLEKLNAIVFLSLKKKGERNNFHPLYNKSKYEDLIKYALEKNISIGFDSCGANKFFNYIKGKEEYKKLEKYVEPCESTRFSIYINVDGEVYPCSFCEGEKGILPQKLIDKDFVKDIWMSKETKNFRTKLLKTKDKNGNIKCPIFEI